MNILSFSYCFPSERNPNWGVFVQQRLAALAELEALQVCSPVPWFPLLKPRPLLAGPAPWQGLTVHRPGFFYLPGFLKNGDARFYARGVSRWLKEFCRDWRPDLLDAHFIWPDGVAVAALAQELGIPYAITLRGKIYECLKIPAQARQCARALAGAAAVISVSSRMADEALKLGADGRRLHVITNGVDLDHFHPRERTDCRQRLGLPVEGRLLVTVAHLGARKGHHEMIRALARLPEDVSLVIVGGEAQGGTVEGLRELARASGVDGRLILPGPQPYDRIPLYFSAADASVLASYREGCPNAVLESLACGIPAITTEVGAVPDILPVPEAGRIVPVRQEGPLGDAIAEVLGREWDPREVARQSGVRSWKRVAEEVREVFRSI
ncbi:MAG: glycosyltransferase family 4 protein [Acidobacteria bacterium]|nr:glycosyltransferase family 4 protein [Acidobacteriota bacterium]